MDTLLPDWMGRRIFIAHTDPSTFLDEINTYTWPGYKKETPRMPLTGTPTTPAKPGFAVYPDGSLRALPAIPVNADGTPGYVGILATFTPVPTYFFDEQPARRQAAANAKKTANAAAARQREHQDWLAKRAAWAREAAAQATIVANEKLRAALADSPTRVRPGDSVAVVVNPPEWARGLYGTVLYVNETMERATVRFPGGEWRVQVFPLTALMKRPPQGDAGIAIGDTVAHKYGILLRGRTGVVQGIKRASDGTYEVLVDFFGITHPGWYARNDLERR